MDGRNAIYGGWVVAELTDRGTSPDRPNNEDAVRHLVHPRNADRLLAVVADGMGGAKGGMQASRIAVDTVCRRFVSDGTRDDVGTLLREMGEEAHAKVSQAAASSPDLAGAGTTLVLAFVDRDLLHFAHVGDSRAYLLRGAELTQLTEDHSLVRKLIESGQLSEDAAETDDRRHILSQAVGRGQRVEVEVSEPVRAQEGDRFLLCSDGLYSALELGEIGGILKRDIAPRAVRSMMDRSLTRGAEDNVTVQVLELATAACMAEARQQIEPKANQRAGAAAAKRPVQHAARPSTPDVPVAGFKPTPKLIAVAVGLLAVAAAAAFFLLRGEGEPPIEEDGVPTEAPIEQPPTEPSDEAITPIDSEVPTPPGLEQQTPAPTPAPKPRPPAVTPTPAPIEQPTADSSPEPTPDQAPLRDHDVNQDEEEPPTEAPTQVSTPEPTLEPTPEPTPEKKQGDLQPVKPTKPGKGPKNKKNGKNK
ncbi:MAG: hypothetical protein GY898_03815 [Proteobacteria bacterium]|nr:hypothetical protein [Pseudomonadota bacterium]